MRDTTVRGLHALELATQDESLRFGAQLVPMHDPSREDSRQNGEFEVIMRSESTLSDPTVN